MSHSISKLTKGHYLAPNYQTYDFDDFLVGCTKYEKPEKTGIWHLHERPMISMVLYGGNLEKRKGCEIHRTTGSLNYYHSYEVHRNDYKVFPSIHISLELEPKFLIKHDMNQADIETAVLDCQDSQLIFLKLLKEAVINDQQAKNSIELTLLSFIRNPIEEKPYSHLPLWIKKTKEIIHDRWNENISLHDLSLETQVHPITISKHFKRYFNCTLGDYMRKLKVKQAITLLSSTNLSLTETAYICGFSDQSHFTRIFKAMTGHLPKEFAKI